MSNELMIVLAIASLAALAGGGFVAWLTGRQRNPAQAYPSATVSQDSAIPAIDDRKVGHRIPPASAEAQQLLALQKELEHSLEHVGTLEDQVAAYLRRYAQAANTLKAEIRQKNQLGTELAAATAQIQALQGRIHELEMERTAATGSRRLIA